MTDLDRLKTQNPIAEVVQRYGVVLQASGHNYRAQCPFHDDHTPSLYIYPEDGSFKCYGASCGLYGDVIDFVGRQLFGSEWDKTDGPKFGAALDALGGRSECKAVRHRPRRRTRPSAPPRSGDERHAGDRQEEKPLTLMVLAALDLAARVYHEHLVTLGDGEATPLRYLYDRGFNWKTIRDGQFGYCPSRSQLLQVGAELMSVPLETLLQSGVVREKRSGRGHYETFYGRITLTDRDFSFRVVHLIGRKFPGDRLPEEAPKYLSLPGWPKPLYGFASLPYRGRGPVMIVEAPIDMLTLRQWGYNAVAVTGGEIKREHAQRLREMDRPLVIIPNNDEAGRQGAKRWREALMAGNKLRTLRLPEKVGRERVKDVNELAQIDRGEEIFADLVKRRLVQSG
ncbi:MAG: CHC2 zinc finger domain-containing protein [Acidobacteriota bacterium]